jgi:hypothetical protein
MKGHAFILLIALFTYITETIKVPVSISENEKKSTCCAKLHMAGKMPCGKKNPAKNGSSACNITDCLKCPLCYSSTMQPLLSTGNPYYNLENQYPDFEEKLISHYFNKAWKPPDAI